MLTLDRRDLLAGVVARVAVAPFAAAGSRAQPLVVLIERNPWLMAVGSDSPQLAVYDDGLAIYRAEAGYKSVRLDPRDLAVFLGTLGIEKLTCLDGYYDAMEGVSDQTTEELIVFQSGKATLIAVYGSLAEYRTRSAVPAAIATAYDRMHGFIDSNARPWLPDRIEVMIWPYPHANQPSIAWPKQWPGLDAPDTVRRHDDMYSLYVPATDHDALIAFLRTRREKGAVEIGGRKWTASLRYPFPEEQQWARLRLREGPPNTCAVG